MEKVVIVFHEIKPHHIEQYGYDVKAKELGLINPKVSGDFDSKIAKLYGEVENYSDFEAKFNASNLSEWGSLYRSN